MRTKPRIRTRRRTVSQTERVLEQSEADLMQAYRESEKLRMEVIVLRETVNAQAKTLVLLLNPKVLDERPI